jgi:predicted nucleic acid-binding protein
VDEMNKANQLENKRFQEENKQAMKAMEFHIRDDDKLFACAVEADADYIVSGDKKDVLSVGVYSGIKTVSPSDFVNHVLPLKEVA